MLLGYLCNVRNGKELLSAQVQKRIHKPIDEELKVTSDSIVQKCAGYNPPPRTKSTAQMRNAVSTYGMSQSATFRFRVYLLPTPRNRSLGKRPSYWIIP